MRRAKGMAASGQYGIGAEMALRRQRAINTDSDSDEEEAVVGGSLRATLGAGHAEGAGGSNLTHNSDTEENMMTDGTTAESEGRKRRRVARCTHSAEPSIIDIIPPAVSRFAAGVGVGQAGRCGLWPLGLKLLCLWSFSKKKHSQKLGAKIA